MLISGKWRINRQLFYIGYGLLVGATWAAAFIDSLLGLQLYQIGDKGIGPLWSLILCISIYHAIMLYVKRIQLIICRVDLLENPPSKNGYE